MATAEDLALGIQTVVYPDQDESEKNFKQPIRIRWDGHDGVNHLCVGTSDGNWDILSGVLGTREQQLFDLSDLPDAVETVYVQRILGDDGAAGPVIMIHRK
ncbi:MAG: hypothetical protein NTNFB02_32770 [Nitrospira sp.]